jgi:hypothetical protein
MSEINLLAFGCVVTFLGVAGAYVHVRESFLARAQRPTRSQSTLTGARAIEREVRDVA